MFWNRKLQNNSYLLFNSIKIKNLPSKITFRWRSWNMLLLWTIHWISGIPAPPWTCGQTIVTTMRLLVCSQMSVHVNLDIRNVWCWHSNAPDELPLQNQPSRDWSKATDREALEGSVSNSCVTTAIPSALRSHDLRALLTLNCNVMILYDLNLNLLEVRN